MVARCGNCAAAVGVSSSRPRGRRAMDVRIETYPARVAACARHVGPYEQVDGTFKRLFAWASAADVLDEDTLVLGLSYDSPETVPASALRYDVCITLAEPVADLPEWIRPA